MMETAQIIEIVKATAGSLDSLISQTAWFFAIKASAHWLSIGVPLLVLFGVILRVASTLKVSGASAEKIGYYILTAWLVFAGSLYSTVNGLAPLLQAAVSPSIYVAAEVSGVDEALKSLLKK